jgi:hypothetical protein
MKAVRRLGWVVAVIGCYQPLSFQPATLTVQDPTSTTVLVDVPILVTLDPTNFDYSAVSSPDSQLAFVQVGSGSAPLPYEVAAWNPEGESFVWVLLGELDEGSAATMTFNYGSAVDAPVRPGQVWTGYSFVAHLDGSTVESTGSCGAGNLDGSAAFGSAELGSDADGSALVLAGSGQGVTYPPSASCTLIAGAPRWSFQFWVHPSYVQLLSDFSAPMFAAAWLPTADFVVDGGGQPGVRFVFEPGSGSDIVTADVKVNQWSAIAFNYDGSDLVTYRDGSAASSVSPSDTEPLAGTGGLPFAVGAGMSGSATMIGDIAELRMSTHAFTSDYLHVEYLAMSGQLVTFEPAR